MMEEKRAGQHPLAEIGASDPQTAARTGSRSKAGEETPMPTDRERALLKDAGEKAKRDQAELRAAKFGDHKGEEGF